MKGNAVSDRWLERSVTDGKFGRWLERKRKNYGDRNRLGGQLHPLFAHKDSIVCSDMHFRTKYFYFVMYGSFMARLTEPWHLWSFSTVVLVRPCILGIRHCFGAVVNHPRPTKPMTVFQCHGCGETCTNTSINSNIIFCDVCGFATCPAHNHHIANVDGNICNCCHDSFRQL